MTALRCGRARCSNSMRRAVTGRSATSTKLRPSFAAALRHRVIAIAGTICEWRMVRAAMRDMLRDIDALISAAAIHYNGHIQIASFPNVRFNFHNMRVSGEKLALVQVASAP